ncbi:uncharacterized protein EV420DRAFT_1622752 [Desarmillaria tabescens]|uniref:Uncharacterized protein n=1 Tax=Armillaria tabescens TaxID=1929756 RepID=A0AA39MSG7_ARMTA|nr:uncharacterized protein EV420DRAFT_1622752 [Desarmillaria tabescens]KAK0444573.1 hypothetical protein EV420DRAFT_1622752 [Desarmillaria tabescens]
MRPVHQRPTDPEHLTLEELAQLVSTTEGYLARDWSLNLGWNNMRYIIESALLQAKLLRRTLIIPSFIYARSCEYDLHVCSDYATMVNKGDALGSKEWLDLPTEQQMAWVLPINLMINVTNLRQSHPVITVSDYLRLHGHDSDAEAPDGQWQRVSYHLTENVLTGKIPELYVIENGWYDPPGTVRVDEMVTTNNEANDLDADEGGIYRTLQDALPGDQVLLNWNTAQQVLGLSSDEDLERVIVDNGWEVVHTFKPLLGMEYSKAVVDPIRQVAPRKALRGFKNDFEGRKEDVVLLAGEVHYGRKPGSMRFTTRAALDEYVGLVLDDVRRIDTVSALADAMVERMYTFTEGRLWMGAHMRRGYNWVMEKTPEEHIARVKNHLKKGREFIGAVRKGKETLKTSDVPESLHITPDMDILKRKVPLPGDWFYVATDERDTTVLEGFRREGAVFMDDLLTVEDRRGELSWPLMLTDFRGLVEQLVLSRAAFFYGHAMSSVAGGVMNLRAMRGMDPRTADVD